MSGRTAAKKNDTTMSQMTSLLKAAKAAWKGRILVATAVVTERNTQAPVGSGSSTRPASACRQLGPLGGRAAGRLAVCKHDQAQTAALQGGPGKEWGSC